MCCGHLIKLMDVIAVADCYINLTAQHRLIFSTEMSIMRPSAFASPTKLRLPDSVTSCSFCAAIVGFYSPCNL